MSSAPAAATEPLTPEVPTSAPKPLATIPSMPTASDKPKAAKTVKLMDLLKADPKKEEKQNGPEKIIDTPFTEEALREAWMAFAEQRKKFQAEYQMLSQPFKLRERQVVVTLLSPVHDTMLNAIKSELASFLRDKLKNNQIQVVGELIPEDEQKKVMYTNREKFEYLVEKNPLLKELKDRLGLDTDF